MVTKKFYLLIVAFTGKIDEIICFFLYHISKIVTRFVERETDYREFFPVEACDELIYEPEHYVMAEISGHIAYAELGRTFFRRRYDCLFYIGQ